MSRPSVVRRPTEDAALGRLAYASRFVVPATAMQLHRRLQLAVSARDRVGARLLAAALTRAA